MHLDPMIFDEHSLRNLGVLDSKNTSFGILYSPLTKQHFPLYYARKLIWNHFCLYQDSNPAWWLRSTKTTSVLNRSSLHEYIYLWFSKICLFRRICPRPFFQWAMILGRRKQTYVGRTRDSYFERRNEVKADQLRSHRRTDERTLLSLSLPLFPFPPSNMIHHLGWRWRCWGGEGEFDTDGFDDAKQLPGGGGGESKLWFDRCLNLNFSS